ncbi:MAG: hypothetical protein U5L73_11480 [Rhodoferax sp.]|uniref:hypothetical protein n=1 Tax=Rhodoferax sp. TaxID=50421 RepID=UPI002ACEA452|nr:hypothetical protein [Rhodoferax sp.]MDZ7892364.1 hypothetical protein [Rhodoferax sp.]
MSAQDNSGPAFPTLEEHGFNQGMPGMSLRDYFAAQALTGMLADPNLKAMPDEFARRSYALADAMLEARQQ